MNTQVRMIDTRTFRIAVTAVAAALLLVVAAYLFGTGLRADTSKSVAASPLGSSLTAIRETRSDDFYGRFSDSAAAARWASVAAGDKRLYVFYSAVNATNAAADQYQNEWMGFSAPESVRASSSAADPYQNEWMGFTSPESIRASSSAAAQYQSTKPEGIKASGAIEAAPGQYQWIRPGGIKVSGAK